MQIITKQEMIDNVPKRWHEQYNSRDSGKQAILEQLKALQKPLKASDVDAIIGNSSWTLFQCDECETDVDTLVVLGQGDDYDAVKVTVCKRCLNAAVKMIKGK